MRRICLIAVLGLLLATPTAINPPLVQAADPASGSIGPSQPLLQWSGATGVESPDRLTFDVAVPPGFWEAKVGGVSVTIEWDNPAQEHDLFVYPCDLIGGESCDSIEESQSTGTTSETVFVEEASNSVLSYTVAVTNRNRATLTAYRGTIRFDWRDAVRFDASRELDFSPTTLVSAHFLGSEPMVSVERPISESVPGAIDPNRVFVDWPLTEVSRIGQLNRSLDGGETFRLLYDLSCAERSRPDCLDPGGGDTFNQVDARDGTVYFSGQATFASHGIASSIDHGDTWPANRQHVLSNAIVIVDRQWLATTNSDEFKTIQNSRVIDAFLSYTTDQNGMWVQAIDDQGQPIAQPVSVNRNTYQMGPIRFDSTNGPGRGWLYQPFELYQGSQRVALGPRDINVTTVKGTDYADPTKWRSNLVWQGHAAENFTWLDLDTRGNAYAVWENEGEIFYSTSPINDPRNDPTASVPGRPGTYWAPIQAISLPDLGSAVFAEVTAGDVGRIAIAYDGTKDIEGSPNCGSIEGEEPEPDCSDFAGVEWRSYAAVITNALAEGGPPVVVTGEVSRRVVHKGNICTEGGNCDPRIGEDRSLLDMIDLDHHADGRLMVVWSDNNSTFAESQGEGAPKEDPFSHLAIQTGGPTLSATSSEVDLTVPQGGREDAPGDATWPNSSTGTNLPSLDALGATLGLEGGQLVARISLSQNTVARMGSDLAAYNAVPTSQPLAERLQYAVRFLTADEIFHLSMESLADGNRRFFGGRLDSNDALTDAVGETFGAGYHTDPPPYVVTGAIEGQTLVLRAPGTAFGLASGDELFGVTAFTMAGPSETEETSVQNPMRTIDATPPFDVVLNELPPPPTPSPSGTGTPPPSSQPLRPASIDLSPDGQAFDVGSEQKLTAIVLDRDRKPVPDAGIGWSLTGQGKIVSRDSSTDKDGRAEAIVFSDEPGNTKVTMQTSFCEEEADCSQDTTIHWGPSFCDIFGTRGNDVLEGTQSSEVICGFGGHDEIDAGTGDDLIYGSSGNDEILGGDGDDTIFGGRGVDELDGGGGHDTIYGGQDDDLIRGGLGGDTLIGGRRHDELRGGRGSDLLDGRIGVDRCIGGRGHTTTRNCE